MNVAMRWLVAGGKGHTTRITSKEQRVSIWLKFEDQKQRVGPLNAKTTASARP